MSEYKDIENVDRSIIGDIKSERFKTRYVYRNMERRFRINIRPMVLYFFISNLTVI